MAETLFECPHPPVAKDGFAIEYACGCLTEWCENEHVSGPFLTLACERHKPPKEPDRV